MAFILGYQVKIVQALATIVCTPLHRLEYQSAFSFPSVKQVEDAKYARAPRCPMGSNSSSLFLI